MQTPEEQQRLLNCTRFDEITGCRLWIRQVCPQGYGRTLIRDGEGRAKLDRAQRASYLAFRGQIPSDMDVRQSCHNKLCINPEHLELYVTAR